MEKTDESEKHEQKRSRQVAMIGLIGTALTVCGGLVGALIGGFTTIYKIQQQAHTLSIAAPQEDQPLSVDTRQISISAAEAGALDPSQSLVNTELGFVVARPAEGWQLNDQMVFFDLFLEEGTNLSPLILFYNLVGTAWDEQPVTRLRYSDPTMVVFVDGSTENGVPVDPTLLNFDTYAFYSQLTVLTLQKSITSDFSVYDLALDWGRLHQGGVNSIVSDPDSRFVFEQVTWQLMNVQVDGHNVDLALQRWALFAEGDQEYYIVEVQYVPASDQSVQVWDDLQNYLSAFRVIQK
jgi:hypothetical protein